MPADQSEEDRIDDAECPTPLVKVNGEDLPTTEEFAYLGSTVRHDVGRQ